MFDLTKALGYVFEDPAWMRKVLTGGALLVVTNLVGTAAAVGLVWILFEYDPFSMGSSEAAVFRELVMALVVLLLVMLPAVCLVWGYSSRAYTNVRAGKELPLPDWNAWREDLALGFQHFLVALGWAAPLILVTWGTYGVLYYVLEHVPGPQVEDTLALIARVATLVFVLLWLAYWILLPAPEIVLAETHSLREAFRISTIARVLREDLVAYGIALVSTGLFFAFSSLGFVFLGVGVFITWFFAQLVALHAFAQLRSRESRTDPVRGGVRS